MYLIDTNIFLEILLEQEKADKCSAFLSKAIAKNNVCLISSYTLHSIETILSNLNRLETLTAFLNYIISTQAFRQYHTTPEEDLTIIQSIGHLQLDFDDALQYYVAKKFSATIITYDKHFRKLKDIKTSIP